MHNLYKIIYTHLSRVKREVWALVTTEKYNIPEYYTIRLKSAK